MGKLLIFRSKAEQEAEQAETLKDMINGLKDLFTPEELVEIKEDLEKEGPNEDI